MEEGMEGEREEGREEIPAWNERKNTWLLCLFLSYGRRVWKNWLWGCWCAGRTSLPFTKPLEGMLCLWRKEDVITHPWNLSTSEERGKSRFFCQHTRNWLDSTTYFLIERIFKMCFLRLSFVSALNLTSGLHWGINQQATLYYINRGQVQMQFCP